MWGPSPESMFDCIFWWSICKKIVFFKSLMRKIDCAQILKNQFRNSFGLLDFIFQPTKKIEQLNSEISVEHTVLHLAWGWLAGNRACAYSYCLSFERAPDLEMKCISNRDEQNIICHNWPPWCTRVCRNTFCHLDFIFLHSVWRYLVISVLVLLNLNFSIRVRYARGGIVWKVKSQAFADIHVLQTLRRAI